LIGGTAPRKSDTGSESETGSESGSEFHKMWSNDSHFGTCVTKFGRNDLKAMLISIVDQCPLLSACKIVADH
jgi:hypothetical protein